MYYVIGGAAVVLMSVFLAMVPDLIRYVKMRSM